MGTARPNSAVRAWSHSNKWLHQMAATIIG